MQWLYKAFPSDREVLSWVFLASRDRELLFQGCEVDRAVDLREMAGVCCVGEKVAVGQGVLEVRGLEVGCLQTAFLGQVDHT